MKNKLLFILSIILIFSLSSCSKEEVVEEQSISSIIISSTQSSINLGETFSFNVKDNNGNTISNDLSLYVNDTEISETTFTPTDAGSYSLYVRYKTFKSNTLTLEVIQLPPTSITISSDLNPVSIGKTTNLIVKDNYGNDVSSEARIFVGGTELTGTTYTATNRASLEFYALLGELESPRETLAVHKYAQKVLIEDYTGTWCGYCPRVINAIELVLAESENVVPVGIHCAVNGGPDPFDFEDKRDLMEEFDVNGFPAARINRTEYWIAPENSTSGMNQVLNKLQTESPLGIGIGSTLSGTDLSIDVSVDFRLDQSNLKLVVYILEDNLTANQANYTNLYNGVPNIAGLEHDHVLRHCLTDLFGNPINSAESTAGNTFQSSFNFDLSNSDVTNTANVTIVAFVVNGSTKTAVNAQEAAINETVSF